jgi:cell surface protein SprA
VRRTVSLNYAFSRKGDFIEPFKNLKGSALKWISEINFNPLPNSFTFGTQMARLFNTTRYRFTGLEDRYNTFFNKRFSWDREYSLNWDLTKAIKFTFSASTFSVIDEPDEVRLLENNTLEKAAKIRKDSIWSNIQQFGRAKSYQHSFTLGYTLPFRVIPLMDWITSRVQYQGQYGWNAAALNLDSLGNQIRNSQNIQANIDFNFEAIYSKIPYLRKIDRGAPVTKTKKGKGEKLRPWTCFTVEPMLNEGTEDFIEKTIHGSSIKYYETADGKLSAQFEHTILLTDTGYEILTLEG